MRGAIESTAVVVEEIPAPEKLAPYAIALSALIDAEDGALGAEGQELEELAAGRIVLLYDPTSPADWEGPFRFVTYVRAELERELGTESLLGSVAWSWLTEAWEKHGCDTARAGGTTTRVLSESFGTLASRPATIDLEIRASWTPRIEDPAQLENHITAWLDLVRTVAGMPPLPTGVTAFPGHRR